MIASCLFSCKPIIITKSITQVTQETKSTFDLTSAKKEIETANREIMETFSKADSVGMANAYSKDGYLMPSNMPSVKGKENITSFWGSRMKAGMSSATLTTLEVWGDENFITEEGLYEMKSKDGAQLGKGKYIVLWKKEEGKWKLHRDIWNSDLPVATK
jgi:ketosteroid isomerase-like protein